MKWTYLFPALTALALAGCKGGDGDYTPTPPPKVEAATVKPGSEETLLPLAEGNQWTYTIETLARNKQRQQAEKQEMTMKVTKVEVTPEGKKAVIEIWSGDTVQDRHIWLVGPKGIFQLATGVKKVETFDPPQPIVLFPLDQNKTFKWKGGSGKVKRELTGKVLPAQEVDTDEKRLSAIPIETDGTNTDGKIVQKAKNKIWLSPGIGIVLFRESTLSSTLATEQLIKLKSHTLK